MSDQAFLTTREVAALLRIKERKVYHLAASGAVPVSRATGKLLFPREAVEAFVARSQGGRATDRRRPAVFLGSQDPLIEWALRASGSGIASLAEGSFDGLDRFARGEGALVGLHIFDRAAAAWNIPDVSARFGSDDVVLVAFARRRRGLVVPAGNPRAATRIPDLAGLRIAVRQEAAGGRRLFEELVAEAAIAAGLVRIGPFMTETDAAMAVLHGAADAAFGLEAAARRVGLGFVPLVEECFDLLVDRAFWFDPPFQRFLAFCRSAAFADEASRHAGYDVSEFGAVRFNAN